MCLVLYTNVIRLKNTISVLKFDVQKNEVKNRFLKNACVVKNTGKIAKKGLKWTQTIKKHKTVDYIIFLN